MARRPRDANERYVTPEHSSHPNLRRRTPPRKHAAMCVYPPSLPPTHLQDEEAVVVEVHPSLPQQRPDLSQAPRHERATNERRKWGAREERGERERERERESEQGSSLSGPSLWDATSRVPWTKANPQGRSS